jgi:hypothetical protein
MAISQTSATAIGARYLVRWADGTCNLGQMWACRDSIPPKITLAEYDQAMLDHPPVDPNDPASICSNPGA